jgi:tetratricopeptide (TPR) repeat protein
MASSSAPSSPCPNCGAEAPREYCPRCGQSQEIETPTVWEWVRDFVDQVLALDVRLPRTLRALATKPGYLTAEWLAGRRARYVSPSRLYLFCSFLFFAGAIAVPEIDPGANSTVRELAGEVAMRAMEGLAEGLSAAEIEDPRAGYGQGPETAAFLSTIFGRELQAAASAVFFLMMPVFALLLTGLYRKHESSYIDHLVFSVHVHSLAFLWLAVTWVVTSGLPVSGTWVDVVFFLLLVYLVGYVVVALRRVYGHSYLGSGARGLLALGSHGILVLLVLMYGATWRVLTFGPGAREAEAHEAYWDAYERFERGEIRAWRELAEDARIGYYRLDGYLYDPHLRYHLGRLLLDTGEPGLALAHARKGLVEDPTHLLSLALAARAAHRVGREEERRDYYRRFLEAWDARIEEYRETDSKHLAALEAIREKADGMDLE